MQAFKIKNNSKISEYIFNDNSVILKFKSGKQYLVNKELYIKNLKLQFNELEKLLSQDFKKIINLLLDGINTKISEYEKENNIKYIVYPKKVDIQLFQDINKSMFNDIQLSNFESFCKKCSDIEIDSTLDDTKLFEQLEEFLDYIDNTLNNFFFTQDLTQFNNSLDYIKIQVPDFKYQYMYFYTKHEVKNGVEIWYKALDPIIWFGELITKDNK